MSTTGTILVTGGTSGLGYEAGLELVKQNPTYHLVLASRTNPYDAAASINKATGRKNTEFLPLDLSSLKNVRAFAADYAHMGHPPIKMLVLNAALQILSGVQYTEDGIEKTFAVNHVGHALLFYLLRPHLDGNCRIVIVASGTHDPARKTMVPDAKYTRAEELAHPSAETAKNDGRQRYATSKLCNVMWTYALHRRLVGCPGHYNWSVASFDPGLMPGTGLARDASAHLRFIWSYVLPYLLPLLRLTVAPNVHSSKDSGIALAKLAMSRDGSGEYYQGLEAIKSSETSYDTEKQEDLWAWTLNTVAKDEAEKRDFEKIYPSAGC